MNVQTERLENQTARLTVDIEPKRFEKAKRRAASQIAKRVNIPGFRKGKVPYRILARNGLEPQIVMDAVENLSQEVYREMLEDSDLEPYGPGSLDDFETEPPKFIYTIPLQPEVELNDYMSVRQDYTEPEVTDESVDDALKRLQSQEALVEESHQPVAIGNRVTIDIHAVFDDDPVVDDEAEADEVENDEAVTDEVEATEVESNEAETGETEADEAVTDEDSDNVPDDIELPSQGDQFIHEHDATIDLDEDEDVILPGFKEELVGADVDDTLEFVIEIPEGMDEEYQEIVGRQIKFEVTIKKIETVTLPALNDEFAARITEDEEDEPLTLLELRMRIRESIEEDLTRRVRDTYVNNILNDMIGLAEFAYPDAMVEDQIDHIMEDLDNRMRQQGISLEDYMKMSNIEQETLRDQYREQANEMIKRSLVLSEIVKHENIEVPEERIEERITQMLSQFGEQGESMRSIFDSPNMRSAIVNETLQDVVYDRIADIGRGIERPAVEAVDDTEKQSEKTEDIQDTTATDDQSEKAEESDVDPDVTEIQED